MAELITMRIEVLSLSKVCFGKQDPQVADAQAQLAEAYLLSGLEKQAVEHGMQALARAQDFDLANIAISAHHTLGRAYTKLSEFNNAKHHLRQSLEATRKLHGRNNMASCAVLSSIAQLHAVAGGDDERVIQTMQNIWDIMEPELGMDHIEMVDTYLELARAFFNVGKDSDCQENLEKVLMIVRVQEVVLADDPSLWPDRAQTDRDDFRETTSMYHIYKFVKRNIKQTLAFFLLFFLLLAVFPSRT